MRTLNEATDLDGHIIWFSTDFFNKSFECCSKCLVKSFCLVNNDDRIMIGVTKPCREFKAAISSYRPMEYE